jgi:Protein of unknown function (DUF1071)
MNELLHTNVNSHTEKKNGLTYLSWAWAWAEVLKVDPQATWEAHEFNGIPCCVLPDTSAMVKTSVTINNHTKSMWLPVMDHKNKAIKGPDAFAINTALVRCLTKTISMHGMGLYIYAGEDLPEGYEEENKEPKVKPKQPVGTISIAEKREEELLDLAMVLIDYHKNGKDMDAVRLFYAPDTFSADIPEANQEKLHLWGLLKNESALRSLLKANKPT